MAQPSQSDVRKAEMAAAQGGGSAAGSVASSGNVPTGNAEITFLETAIQQVLKLGSAPLPDFNTPSSNKLLSVLQEFSSIADKALGTAKSGTEAARVAGETLKQGVTLESTAVKEQVAANEERARAVAENAGRFIEMFAGQNAERIATMAETKRQLEDKLFADKAEILRRQSINPLEHPVDWVVAQITTPGKIAEHNILVSQVNGYETAIEEAIAGAQRSTELSAMTIPAITAKQAAAQAQVAEAVGTQKRAAADIAAAERDIDFSTKQISVANATVAAETTAYRTRFEAAQADFNTKVNAVQRAENSADRRLRLAEFISTLADKKVIVEILTSAERVAGVPAGTFNPTRWKLMSKAQQDSVIALGVGSGGAEPVEALKTYQEVGVGENLDPRRRTILSVTADFVNTVRGEQGYKQQTGKEAQEAYVRKRVGEMYGQFIATPDSPDPRNPYKALGVQEMFIADPLMEHTQAGKALAQFKNVKTPVTTEQIVEAIVVATGGDTKKSANMISDYFKRNVIRRNELLQYPSVGLKEPGMPSYKTRFKLPSMALGFGGGDVVVDLVQPAEVENYLLRRELARKRQEAFPVQPINP